MINYQRCILPQEMYFINCVFYCCFSQHKKLLEIKEIQFDPYYQVVDLKAIKELFVLCDS
jgi:hypothetical protein